MQQSIKRLQIGLPLKGFKRRCHSERVTFHNNNLTIFPSIKAPHRLLVFTWCISISCLKRTQNKLLKCYFYLFFLNTQSSLRPRDKSSGGTAGFIFTTTYPRVSGTGEAAPVTINGTGLYIKGLIGGESNLVRLLKPTLCQLSHAASPTLKVLSTIFHSSPIRWSYIRNGFFLWPQTVAFEIFLI